MKTPPRRTLGSLLAILALALSTLVGLPSASADTSSPSDTVSAPSRLSRVGADLVANGVTVRPHGVNAYWLALNDNVRDASGNPTRPSQQTVRDTFSAAVAMNADLVRVTSLGVSLGGPNTLMPTPGVYDQAAFAQADMVIAEAARAGVRLMVPLTDRYSFYHGGALRLAQQVLGPQATISDYYTNADVMAAQKAYDKTLLNHVNTVTGVRWGDDPTLAIWETGNEMYDAPTAWSRAMSNYIRNLASNALIADGTAASGLHDNGTNGSGAATGTSTLGLPNIDIVGGHFYDDHRMDIPWMNTDAKKAANNSKAYLVGEFDWTDGPNNGSSAPSTSTTRAQWLSAIESNANVDGDLMWGLLVPAAGVHRDRYEMYVPTENSEQAAGLADLTAHFARMGGTTATALADARSAVPGFPTAKTTGPRVATSPGSGNICGTVSGRLITGDLVLGCDSTVTDSRITGRIVSNGYRLTGSYLDIGPDACPAEATSDFQAVRGEVTLDHTHLHNNPGQDEVALLGATTIKDSLINRMCFYPGDHLDGAQYYDPGAVGTILLEHNSIDAAPVNDKSERGNSAVILADTPGRGTLITLKNNRVQGGNYTLMLYDAFRGSGVRYVVQDNVFVSGTWTYGPCASNSAQDDGTDGLLFTGNKVGGTGTGRTPLTDC